MHVVAMKPFNTVQQDNVTETETDLFHASSGAAQVHAQEDDYDEQVEGEHDPVDGLRDETPSGRVDFLVARDVVGAGDVHGLHVDGVTASGWELRERGGAHLRDTLCH